MQIQPTVSRPSASATIGAPTETNGAGFASLLRQRMPTPEPTLAPQPPPRAAVPAPPSPAAPTPAAAPTAEASAAADDAAPAPATDSPDAAPTTSAAGADATLRGQWRARLRAIDTAMANARAAGDDPVGADATPTTAPEPAEATDAAGKADAAPPTHPTPDASAAPAPLDLPLPALQPPPPDASPATDASAPRPADARSAPVGARGSPAAAPRADDDAAHPGAALAAAPTRTAFAGLLAAQPAGTPSNESARGTAIDASLPTGVGAGAYAAAPVPGTAAPQAVAVATPVNAPDFAQQLGLQLSVLAKDGVHQAELHLNPADMGPVSVQITMDGTQARIDFGAEVAATRHAIEAGLPQLAGALADAGFTLAGGGVSSHAGGRGDGGGGGRDPSGSGRAPTRATGIAVTESAAPAARRVVSMGGLDLYA